MCSFVQILVTPAFLWKKLTQPQFYKDLTRKAEFFERWSWFKFNNLGLALDTNLKFYTSVAKRLKLKVRKFSGLIPTFVEVTEEKLVGRVFMLPQSWVGLMILSGMSESCETLQLFKFRMSFSMSDLLT